MKKHNFLYVFLILLFVLVCNFSAACANDELKDEKISVNCCFSIGKTCRSAYHIQKSGKRFFASPLDWMRDYSLDTCLHLFKTNFSDFFEEVKEVKPWPGATCRSVKDTKNEILSIHHFSKNKPVLQEQKRFRKLMQKRAKRLNNTIKKSKSLALVYHRDNDSDTDKLIDFLKKFSDIYPQKNIFIIDVVHCKEDKITRKTIFEEKNLKIIQFSFSDAGGHWTGNSEGWKKVMDCIEIKNKQNS